MSNFISLVIAQTNWEDYQFYLFIESNDILSSLIQIVKNGEHLRLE